MINMYRKSFFLADYKKMFLVGLQSHTFNLFVLYNTIVYTVLSASTGIGLSLVISYLIQYLFFEGMFVINYKYLFVISLLVVLISYVGGSLLKIPRIKPGQINRSN